jgi:hypothetical protein
MKVRAILQHNQMKKSINNKIMPSKSESTINIFQNKAEILFNQKTFLEILLGFIKKAQVDYLTNNKLNGNIDNSIKSNKVLSIKKVLKELNDNLLEIKEEKDKSIDLLEKKTEQKKDDLRKLIFSTVYTKRSISNYNYINVKHETLITENNENYYNKETPELKLLNFQVENDIKKVDNLTKRIRLIIHNYKTPHIPEASRTEIIHDIKRNDEMIDQLLHQKLMKQRENFIEAVNLKNILDLQIGSLKYQVIGYKNEMKEMHKSYKYVNSQDVIAEENKSYLETINEDIKNENFKNSISGCQNGTIDNNNINNYFGNDFKNMKYINMNDVDKLLKLNMNINVNIKHNKKIINNHFDHNNDKKNNKEDEDHSSYYSKEENFEDDFDIDDNDNRIKIVNEI